MTPLVIVGIVLLIIGAVVAMRRARRHIPSPERSSDRYDQLTAQVQVAHERSLERTAALNRDLEMLRTGRERKGTRYDR